MESRLENIQLQLRTDHESLVRELESYSIRTVYERDIDAPGDLGDAAVEIYEDEKRLTFTQSITEKLSDIEHALINFENGTYSYCDVCHKEIPLDRLKAIPSTSLCLDCKDHLQKAKSIPVSIK